ncbi:expansin EXLX1 family cellulose-binding protein [Dactylosporangium sp. NPDC051485]|uniref:expansin EXLX1 family cellulose-binding protein n=1 Tax=Dactylosporangium sp. NPDC051485 TaxID=3154846 RepID=UPI00343320B9
MADHRADGPWWRTRRVWVVAGAGVLVAAAASVALVAQASGAACAALAATSGQATYYAADGSGNCSFDQVAEPLVVALGNAEYRGGAACGGYLDVKGPKGTVRVKVVDRCPECAAGHLDLSRQAFAKIGNVSDGIIAVSYSQVVNPAVPGPVTVRVKEGASRYWLALRFDNTGNPVAQAEVRSGDGWKALARTDYNYWIAESGAGNGPFTVRVTDTQGRQTTLNGVALSPGVVQRPGATASPRTSAPGRSPSPSVIASASPAAPTSAGAPESMSAALAGTSAPESTSVSGASARC